jgi:hypothetical protein
VPKPPEILHVGPYRYTVTLKDKIKSGGVDRIRLGETHRPKGTIKLNRNQSEDQLRDTMWHETMHAVFEHMQLNPALEEEEEKIVSALATGTLDVLRRNPELVSYLVG